MSDWKEILDLIICESSRECHEFENPLLIKAIEYLYSILLGLKKDSEEEKIIIDDETELIFLKKMVHTRNKCGVLGINIDGIVCKSKILLNCKKVFENEEIVKRLDSSDFYKRHRIKKYNLKKLHQVICEELFEKIGNSYGTKRVIWVSLDTEIEENREGSWYDHVVEKEGKKIVKLEIISENILEYDRHIFEMLGNDESNLREKIKKNYRPYIVEYYIVQNEFEEAQSEFLQKMYQEKGWYRVSLAKENEHVKDENTINFDGIFVHSASPVNFDKRRLVVVDQSLDQKLLDRINDIYNMNEVECASDKDIQNELEKLFAGTIFEKTRIYKVGNGSCIYNYGKENKNKKRFFYDIGFDMHVHVDEELENIDKKYRMSIKNIRNCKPQCIILSHWDADHFRGCVYASKRFFDIKWIAPNIQQKERKANAKRLYLYLYKTGNLLVVSRTNARQIANVDSKKSSITLYMGNGKAREDHEITLCNRQGIVLCLKNKQKSGKIIRCLMQGDVPYRSLPGDVQFLKNNPYEYFVVPHHGASMNYDLLVPAAKKSGKAIICCTNNTKGEKNRPKAEHLHALEMCYEDVKKTEEANSYIELDLRRENTLAVR